MMDPTKTLERSHSLLNTSVSKQMYSFGKAARFKYSFPKDIKYAFYSIPETKSKRSCGMGYGNKFDFTKAYMNKCASQYTLPDLFNPNSHNSPQYTFGVSRVASPTHDRKDLTPGPKYDTTRNLGENAPSCIISANSNIKKSNLRILSPGPGAYLQDVVSPLGKYSHSKYKNVSTVRLDTKSKRFIYKPNNVPGPGQYYLPSLINKQGHIFQSNFKASPPRSFLGKPSKNSSIEILPGPGQYNSFSEFEGYENLKR